MSYKLIGVMGVYTLLAPAFATAAIAETVDVKYRGSVDLAPFAREDILAFPN
jgi:hypothetical protein